MLFIIPPKILFSPLEVLSTDRTQKNFECQFVFLPEKTNQDTALYSICTDYVNKFKNRNENNIPMAGRRRFKMLV